MQKVENFKIEWNFIQWESEKENLEWAWRKTVELPYCWCKTLSMA